MSPTRRPGSGHPLPTSRPEDRHVVRNARIQPIASSAAIQAQIVPSLGAPVSSRIIRRRLAEGHLGLRAHYVDESGFNFSSDDNHVGVWRPRGERLTPAFALQRHTAPTAGVMVWGAIACNTQSPLALIHGTMTAHVATHGTAPRRAIFQQDNAQPQTARVSQDCLRTVNTLPWPARSSNLSPIEHIWDHLGRRVRHPMSLNELEVKLQ
ncbi:transposable element Tcb2 transposase [Trichonephila clavipes]|nr:transposable element Tcb2 transposase [Trichonephila clavipes]